MTMLPLKTAISDTYPNPSNATARAGFAQMWDALNEFQQKSELDLASAATCDIGGQLSTKLRITGTTGITSFGTNYRGPIMLRFAGAVTLTHNATTLRIPGGVNMTTTADDVLMAWPTATVSGTLDGWEVALIGPVIPPGTVMAFFQAAAPTGWTQVTTHNNKALRIVSGAGGGSGGSVSFTSAFASQAVSGTNSATTLNSTQIPSHTHSTTFYGTTGGGIAPSSGGSPSGGTAIASDNGTGGGLSHGHTFTGTAINLAVQYIDMILASKK